MGIPVPWWLFFWGFHGLSLLLALAGVLHSVRCCWWAADPSLHPMGVPSWGLGSPPGTPTQQDFLEGDPEAQTASYKLPWGTGAGRGRRTAWVVLAPEKVTGREQGPCSDSMTVQVCCCHIHTGCLIAVALWNALIFTESHRIDRVGGDLFVDEVLSEFLRIFINQAGGDFYKGCAVPHRASLGWLSCS